MELFNIPVGSYTSTWYYIYTVPVTHTWYQVPGTGTGIELISQNVLPVYRYWYVLLTSLVHNGKHFTYSARRLQCSRDMTIVIPI